MSVRTLAAALILVSTALSGCFASANNTNLTAGAEIVLDASASSDPMGGNLSFAWDLGDGNSTEGMVTNHTYAAEGNFTVTLTVVSDASQLNGSANQTLVVVAGAVKARAPMTFTDASGDGTTNYHDLRLTTVSDDADLLTIKFTTGAVQPSSGDMTAVCYQLFLKAGAAAELRFEIYGDGGAYVLYDTGLNRDVPESTTKLAGTGFTTTASFENLGIKGEPVPLQVRLESWTWACTPQEGNPTANGPLKLDVAGPYMYQ
ncbi:MAG: PKD domain-containing protein [Euryarchaeota archaeon]|nr:PKD domain-containing protein [Euryarchaeota archaeon]